ncbi:MAG: hypothetical protein IKJ01_03080, partial [Lachnospiraceae bacterium]|nr:hypothetical protein [Lachnospiraceae bacterium]
EQDSMLAAYEYDWTDDYKRIFTEQPRYAYAFLHAAIKECQLIFDWHNDMEKKLKNIADFVLKQYEEYQEICASYGFVLKDVTAVTELQQLYLPESVTDWEKEYLKELFEQPEKAVAYFFGKKQALCLGEILRLAEFMQRMIKDIEVISEFLQKSKEYLICEGDDLLELWYDLSLKMAYKNQDVIVVKVRVYELQQFIMNTRLYEKQEVDLRFRYYNGMDFPKYVLTHPLDLEKHDEDGDLAGEVAELMSPEQVLATDITSYIMEYAGFGKEEIVNCKKLLKTYGEVAELSEIPPEGQKARKELTNLFYDIYEKAFFRAVKANTIPMIMELFFQFGVLDVNLAGKNNVRELISVVEKLRKPQKTQQEREQAGENFARVYSIYQWLRSIYNGEKEPSKNEFDVDYAGDLLEQRKNQTITKAEENELKHNQEKKVEFELRNMFQSNNRTTYGRITSFCPILHKKEFIRPVEQMFISLEKANEVINEIRKTDYSCFYREIMFVAPKHGIDHTQIMKEVMPEIILMPNVGNRAMMWQETSGVKRDTPARFTFPILTVGDFNQMMLETIGRYRWEICRKVMGVRWNDIREKSLTSEFYDYVQFYRKNSELSSGAKEKLKSDLVHAKNNYREVFVMDYMSWMKYEAQGNFRLNKVSRRIIAQHVPFPKAIRAKLSDNPMYKELFAKSDILRKHKKDKEKLLFDRYLSAGGKLTAELEAHLQFYDM